MTESTNEQEKPEVTGTEHAQPDTGAEAASGANSSAPPAGDPQAEIAELKDRLLRSMAEVENIRKRAERDRQDAAKYGIASFARDLLSVADNLRRALDSLPEAEQDEKVRTFVEGVEMTERELLKVFEKSGIRRLDPLGEKFDHNFHEAMFEVPSADQPAGTVVQVIQPGYVIHDRLLRAARVGVSRAIEGTREDNKVDTRA